MELLESFFGVINDLTWGWALVPFLVVMGLFFTISTGFVQIRYFKRMFRVFSSKNQSADPNAISAREALLVSVGGRVGGGNIAGVAVAITLGGPGAVFWMWAIAAVGMATSLIECSLSQLYKQSEPDGTFRGGPARTIVRGLGENYRWLASVYAVCLIASFAIGFNAFQGNTVAGAALDSMGIERLWTGVALAIGTGLIVYGGIHRIAKVADVIVPVMAFSYILLAILVILINIADLPRVIGSIFSNAFGFEQAVGGGMGAALAQGLRRGLFSNEAGLGSAPNVAATADVRHPVSQGITQSLSVFIDTYIICTCTAFVILLFAFSSIIYNYYLGENALTFMTKNKLSVHVLRLIVVAIVFLGAVAPGATAVFFFSDPMMGILAVVNLLALMMLFPTAKRLIDDFRAQLKSGVARPVLNPDDFADLDIERDVWSGKVGSPE